MDSRARALSRPGARHARAAPPRGRRDRPPLPEAAAPGRRLQHRHDRPMPATTWRICWSAPKERWRFSARSSSIFSRYPPHRVLGICHFPTFYQAMDATQHIVKLGPAAVELVDRTMIELARDNPVFRPVVDRFVRGEPDAILLTEFAGDDRDDNLRRLEAARRIDGRSRLRHPVPMPVSSRRPTRPSRARCGTCARKASTS